MSNIFQGAASPCDSVHSNFPFAFPNVNFHLYFANSIFAIESSTRMFNEVKFSCLRIEKFGRPKIDTEERFHRCRCTPRQRESCIVSLLYTIGRAINSVPRRESD